MPIQGQAKKVVFLLLLLTLIVFIGAHAQIGDPGSGGSGSGDPDDVPIDGGLSLLVAAGIGYGTKKAKQLGKK